jgi:transposase
MRPACVFTDVPVSARAQIMELLHGPWRTATRLIIVVLSAAGFSPAEIAALLDYHPATVRRWLHRYATDGIGGLPDRPRPGRPRLGGPALTGRIAALLQTPGPWTVRRIWHRLGRPAISLSTLWRRTRAVAGWRRPRLVAKGDPDHDQVCARIRRRIAHLPAGSVVLTEDETHLDLLPSVRATRTLQTPHGHRHQVMTPGHQPAGHHPRRPRPAYAPRRRAVACRLPSVLERPGRSTRSQLPSMPVPLPQPTRRSRPWPP